MYDIIIIFAILYYILSLLNINTLLILLILFIIFIQFYYNKPKLKNKKTKYLYFIKKLDIQRYHIINKYINLFNKLINNNYNNIDYLYNIYIYILENLYSIYILNLNTKQYNQLTTFIIQFKNNYNYLFKNIITVPYNFRNDKYMLP
jgi:hypothetical protein|tara:strand:- start:22380 stop:22820 length:441 start_codon:yes stop_codon:yes gene_type:complete